MKMLLIGSFSAGALENIYSHHFLRLGWEVLKFDIRTPYLNKINNSLFAKVVNRISISPFVASINKLLLAFAESTKPDVILIFKGMELFPSTVGQLKDNTKVLANLNPDHPFYFFSRGSGNENISKSLKFYHCHFSYSKRITQKLNDKFYGNAFWIPFGYDERYKDHFKKLPDHNQIIFIGAFDRERHSFFKELNEKSIKIYGEQKWANKGNSKTVKEMYQGKPLYDEDYFQTTSSALGSLNLLRKQNLIEKSHNMRTFEVPGCKGVLISQRTDEQQTFFEDKKEALFFDSVEELREIVKDINSKVINVNIIKKNAFERSERSNYSYFHRAKSISAILTAHLKG